MIGWTFCSGIGAPELAAPWVDWRLASEVERFPRAVLKEQFSYMPPSQHTQGAPLLWGDMTEVTPDLARAHGVPLPNLVVAGTPCQAFSIAGLRGGTEDARGNLTLKFVETCHAIVDARPDGRLAVLWENVPGVLSDTGNAFGCFLAGLVGADAALLPPEREWGFVYEQPPVLSGPAGAYGWKRIKWPSAGMVAGPRARAAWRVCDAQYFGLAQRRRRVFVVVDFGNCIDPAAVLFERQSEKGNTPPRREAGQNTAGTLSARTEGGGGLGTDFELGGGLQPSWPAEVAPTLNAHFGDKMGLEDQHALNGAGLFVPVAFDCKGTEVQFDETGVTGPLRAMGHNNSHQNAGGHAAVAIGGPTAHTLTAVGHDASEDGSGRGTPVIAIQERAVAENPSSGPDGAGFRDDDAAYTLEARTTVQAVALPSSVPHVRRLMPLECERLQGVPDGHTAITYRGKPAADGPRYKSLGNSMAVKKVRWIMDRMRVSMHQQVAV